MVIGRINPRLSCFHLVAADNYSSGTQLVSLEGATYVVAIRPDLPSFDLSTGKRPCPRGTNTNSFVLTAHRGEDDHDEIDDESESTSESFLESEDTGSISSDTRYDAHVVNFGRASPRDGANQYSWEIVKSNSPLYYLKPTRGVL